VDLRDEDQVVGLRDQDRVEVHPDQGQVEDHQIPDQAVGLRDRGLAEVHPDQGQVEDHQIPDRVVGLRDQDRDRVGDRQSILLRAAREVEEEEVLVAVVEAVPFRKPENMLREEVVVAPLGEEGEEVVRLEELVAAAHYNIRNNIADNSTTFRTAHIEAEYNTDNKAQTAANNLNYIQDY
jgi:hypothetical protein